MAPPDTEAHNIVQALKQADRTQRWLSTQTGIPMSSLGRKLNGKTDFKVNEVVAIAFALHVAPHKLLSSRFDAKPAASERRVLTGIAA